MQSPIKIAIVILNYNGTGYTIDCLRSIYQIDYPNFEVIVVDNGSKEKPSDYINSNFSGVIYIQNEENLGFAEGCNVGIKKALERAADYILLLNNDTKVDRNILSAFAKGANSKPKGGIFGGKILKFHDPDVIDHIGGRWDRKKGDFVSFGSSKHISSAEFCSMKKVDYVCGCFMLIRKDVFEKIGFLEKDFFLIWEEADFCFRAKRAGFEIWTVPEAHVWHKISASFTGGTVHSDYFWWRNRFLWIKRNLSFWEKINIYFIVLIPDLFKLYKLTFLKTLQFYYLKLFNSSKIDEKKVVKLLRYRSGCRGVLDFFLKRFGPGPKWILNPKSHRLYLYFKETSLKN